MAEPSYEDLVAQRQREWAQAQAKAASELTARHAAIQKMPDVAHGPAIGALWGQSDVICACGGEAFKVQRYVTVNGRAHRIETSCLGCQRVGTWDFAERRWIG